jgi:hypothetical protein
MVDFTASMKLQQDVQQKKGLEGGSTTIKRSARNYEGIEGESESVARELVNGKSGSVVGRHQSLLQPIIN